MWKPLFLSVLHSAQLVAAREECFQAVGQAILPAAAFQAALWLRLRRLVGQAILPAAAFSGGVLVAAMLLGGAGGSPALARIPAQPDAASFGSERLNHPTSEMVRLLFLPMWAQKPDTTALDAQAAELRALVQRAPQLAYKKVEVQIQPPGPDFGIGYPSSVAMDNSGLIYFLQRHEEPNRPPVRGNADPIIVVNRDGKVLRSWGKGMFKIPHSIRIDPKGNIWTVDSSSSMVYEFTPMGAKLMEISVGGQPATKSGFNGTTDIAFAPNGHLFISDGYGNARILEYTADGKRLREWGSAGTGPGQFHQPHGIAVDADGIIYVADRQNGRLQRFDLTGRYLGEWANLGMVTTVAIRAGDLWIGTQQRNEPTGSAGWLMKIDRHSGKVLGYVDSAHGHHVVNVTRDGDLVSGARPDTVLWFRRP